MSKLRLKDFKVAKPGKFKIYEYEFGENTVTFFRLSLGNYSVAYYSGGVDTTDYEVITAKNASEVVEHISKEVRNEK